MSEAEDRRVGARASWRAVAGSISPAIAVLAGGVLFAAETLRITPIAVLRHVEAYLVTMGFSPSSEDAERARRSA